MENLNKESNQGLAAWSKRPIEMRSSSMMPPTTLPLAPSSFQVWKKPYLMTGGKSSGPNKSLFKMSSVMTNLSAADNNKNSQISSSDKNPVSLDSITPVTSAARDNNNALADNTEVANGIQIRLGHNIENNMDPRKLKRIISNRVSAQKSRMKKAQYVASMENKVKALEEQIAVLSPEVALLRSRHHFLLMEHKRLNIETSARTDHKKLQEAEIEENKAEVNRLKQLYVSQHRQKMQELTMAPVWEHGHGQLVNPNLILSSRAQRAYMEG